MEITEEIIRKTATLARLRIKDDEVNGLKQDLSNILSHIDKLSEVDVSGIEPTFSTIPPENVFREDSVEKRFGDVDLLKLAPQSDHGHYTVPKVI